MYSLHTRKMSLKEEVATWAKTAPKEEIDTALEIGYLAIKRAAGAKPAPVVVPTAPVEREIAVVKGQKGEAYVESVLNKRFGNVINMTKQAKSGDLTLFLGHSKVIVEVKNYDNEVPAAGVEKFQRDLSTTNAAAGVFVSLKTRISGIDSPFLIRYEYTDTKMIPTVYFVGSTEEIIISAIKIVEQLIKATGELVEELYARDKILGLTYDASEALDTVSKTRNDLLANITTITGMLQKNSLGLVNAETVLRKALDEMKAELFHKTIAGGAVAAELQQMMNDRGYEPQIHEFVAKISSAVSAGLHKRDVTAPTWKTTARKCLNVNTGIGFNFLQAKVELFVPRARVQPEQILHGITALPKKKITIDDNVNVELDPGTIEYALLIVG